MKYTIKHYIIYNKKDLDLLPKEFLPDGSTAYILSTEQKYMIDNHYWVLIAGEPDDEYEDDKGLPNDDIIIYDGGEIL